MLSSLQLNAHNIVVLIQANPVLNGCDKIIITIYRSRHGYVVGCSYSVREKILICTIYFPHNYLRNFQWSIQIKNVINSLSVHFELPKMR